MQTVPDDADRLQHNKYAEKIEHNMSQLLTPTFPDYELIDSGDFEKLERFGRHVTRRPEPQAIWHKTLSEEEWRRLADASFLKTSASRLTRA